jgi:hypothetical protein
VSHFNFKNFHLDQEIKLKLSSLQFVKKRIEICLTNLLQSDSLSNKKSSLNTNATALSANNIIVKTLKTIKNHLFITTKSF